MFFCLGILFGCWEHDGEEKKKPEKLELCLVLRRSEGGNLIKWWKVAALLAFGWHFAGEGVDLAHCVEII